jgi:hypothetical protein
VVRRDQRRRAEDARLNGLGVAQDDTHFDELVTLEA